MPAHASPRQSACMACWRARVLLHARMLPYQLLAQARARGAARRAVSRFVHKRAPPAPRPAGCSSRGPPCAACGLACCCSTRLPASSCPSSGRVSSCLALVCPNPRRRGEHSNARRLRVRALKKSEGVCACVCVCPTYRQCLTLQQSFSCASIGPCRPPSSPA